MSTVVTNNITELDERLSTLKAQSILQNNQKRDDNETIAKAFSSVLTYILSDAFDLTGDEIVKVAYYIGETVAPLEKVSPSAVPPVVLEEVKFTRYSDKLFTRSEKNSSLTKARKTQKNVRTATLSTWVEGFSDILFNSYTNLPPMYKSRIVGSLHGIFKELGLDNDITKTRPSLYLPSAIRTLLS